MDYETRLVLAESLYMSETDLNIGTVSFGSSALSAHGSIEPALSSLHVPAGCHTIGSQAAGPLNELHAAARSYHEVGLPITLCRPGGKVPIATKWHHKVWTPAEIDAQFETHADLNVGLILGPRSGIIDIEIDGAGGDAELQELFQGDVPVAPIWRSARGAHRLFAWHDELTEIGKSSITISSLEFRLGADGRAAQSLLPPSITDGWGRRWTVPLDECDPPPLPTCVLRQLVDSFGRRDCAGLGLGTVPGATYCASTEKRHSIKIHSNIAVSHAVSHPHGTVPVTGNTQPCTTATNSVEAAIKRAIAATVPGTSGVRTDSSFSSHVS